MVRHGMPPPPCLPTLPLPSTRGAAGLRQRPVPSRGGQLQVGGIVVGSWGANYGYGGGSTSVMRQQQQQPSLVGGYHHQGRGRGGMPSPMHTNFQPQLQQQQFGRGRHQRKQGPPTYNVNKKNNVSFVFCFWASARLALLFFGVI